MLCATCLCNEKQVDPNGVHGRSDLNGVPCGNLNIVETFTAALMCQIHSGRRASLALPLW